jgi:hypothetical protein
MEKLTLTFVLILALYCSFTVIEAIVVDIVNKSNKYLGIKAFLSIFSCVLWGIFYYLSN